MVNMDEISIYELYKADKLSEEAIRLLLGEEFDLLQEDIGAFAAAAADDTSQYLI
jgi:hypothetical protein